jgi:hypothetical protein
MRSAELIPDSADPLDFKRFLALCPKQPVILLFLTHALFALHISIPHYSSSLI